MSSTAARRIAAVYPPAIRRHWGPDLTEEIDAQGAAGWVDALLGALRLWLRPTQWPATASGDVRQLAVVLGLATTAGTGLAVRTVAVPPAARNVLLLTALTILAGAAAVVPLPRRGQLGTVLRRVTPIAVTAVGPCAAVVVLAALPSPGSGLLRAGEVVLYWLALSIAIASPAVAIARSGTEALLPPGTARATVGLSLIVGGQLGATVTCASVAAGPAALLVGVVGLGAASLTALALTDLHRRLAA